MALSTQVCKRKTRCSPARCRWEFEHALPRIRLHACIAFRDVRCRQKRDDCIAEVVALSWKWWLRLRQRGKNPLAFVSAIATFAARAVRSGRRLCGQERAKDVLSFLAQQFHSFRVESLPSSTATAHEHLYGEARAQQQLDAFEERLQDNTQTPVPDQAAFRIDFPAWLSTLTARERRIIRAMARNERTKDLSTMFELSPARISQLRQEFHNDWQQFITDAA